MCWFISIGVRSEGVALLEHLGNQRSGLTVHPSVNTHVANLFPGSDSRFEITRHGCSCELYVCPREIDPKEQEHARQRYRRKGWPEAKIARAIAARETAKSASVGRNPERGPERLFRDAITELVRQLGGVRLFVHMYTGSQAEELVTSEGQCRMDLTEFLAVGFPPDKLVEVTPTATQHPI